MYSKVEPGKDKTIAEKGDQIHGKINNIFNEMKWRKNF